MAKAEQMPLFTQHPVEIGKPLPDDLVVSSLASEPQHIEIKKVP